MDFDYDDIIIRYQAFRKVGVPLNTKLARLLNKEEIHAGARMLGMLGKKDVLIFEDESEVDILMDYCLYSVLRDGKNLVDCCLSDPPVEFLPDEIEVLKALRRSRYTMFGIMGLEPGTGIHAMDMLYEQERLFVADVLFSQTGKPGMLLAGRLIPLAGFWATTGAALPVSGEANEAITQALGRIVISAGIRRFEEMSKEQEAELSSQIIRILRKYSASSNIAYGESVDSGLPGEHGESAGLESLGESFHPSVRNFPRKIGPNDPCPCGSGKKHKKCCGRGK